MADGWWQCLRWYHPLTIVVIGEGHTRWLAGIDDSCSRLGILHICYELRLIKNELWAKTYYAAYLEVISQWIF